MSESTTGIPTADRRRHERLQPRQRVAIRGTEGVLSVFGWGKAYEVLALLDLSSGGARLSMQEAPNVGSVLRLDFKTDEGPTFEAIGEIRWTLPGASGSRGFTCGIEFFKSTARQRQEITDLCRRVHRGPEGVLSSSRGSISA